MKILVTGAKGFVGKNLCCALYNLKDGKDRTRPNLYIDEVYEYDLDTPEEKLDEYCEKADFVFHLAGVNRPKDNAEFMQGNFGFSSVLLDTLKRHKNTCPVMLSSSVQATLIGRYGQSDYGKSKFSGVRNFSSRMRRKRAPGYLSIASRICSGSGAVPTITAPWRPFAATWQTTSRLRSTIGIPNSNSFI